VSASSARRKRRTTQPKVEPLSWFQNASETALPRGLTDAAMAVAFPDDDPMKNDPTAWIKQFSFIWSKQSEIVESVRDHRFTAVKACHGPGKSYIAGWAAVWWYATHEDAMIVTSAPSGNQVKNILWKEIGRAHRRANLPGYITGGEVPEWKVNGEVVGFGRKPADYTDSDKAMTSFQGIHAKHVLVILDEGSGIPEWLANATETLITNENCRFLIIGNPDNPNSYFARQFKPNSGFNKISIRAWDLPAYTGERVPDEVAQRLTSKMWVEERRRRWGEGSILWMSKVEAEFPEVSEDTLFTPAVLNKGFLSDRSRLAHKTLGRCGMDVARLGADETVVYHNRNGHVRLKGRWAKFDSEETVGKFRSLWQHDGDEIPGAVPPTLIDVTGGTGAGPFDRLRHLGFPVHPFNASEKATNPLKFLNRRAEVYWEAKELMEEGLVDIDELDEELQQELLEHKFKYNSTGRIQIESKEEVTKRLGRSPDRADSFTMALPKRFDILKHAPTPDEIVALRREDPTGEDLVSDLMDVAL
jgi:hypothetical protein